MTAWELSWAAFALLIGWAMYTGIAGAATRGLRDHGAPWFTAVVGGLLWPVLAVFGLIFLPYLAAAQLLSTERKEAP